VHFEKIDLNSVEQKQENATFVKECVWQKLKILRKISIFAWTATVPRVQVLPDSPAKDFSAQEVRANPLSKSAVVTVLSAGFGWLMDCPVCTIASNQKDRITLTKSHE
jgi:hypothetical protein